MGKDNGGAAFPCIWEGTTRGDASGMTLRDYFAAKAMQGMFASDTDESVIPIDRKASQSYLMADAMLKARGK